MDFQVSALKWRPQKFAQMVGQEPIIRTLQNAIKSDRVAHAYLFSGPRGVGKTTTARVFAKALNCENGPSPEPCDTCINCEEIKAGRSMDVAEVDGASNNGVAEVRELIEKVKYSAASCRYKVYVIDEVHMLSKSAFNALLKTLEEPPPKVVFIFATTEVIKIPETILSRCQCFEYKALSREQVAEQLGLICKEEGISVDPTSLRQIAKSGGGSMRDSQSFLDQAIAFCGSEINSEAVETVLGAVSQDVLEGFCKNLVDSNALGLIEKIQEIIRSGKDLNIFCRDLMEFIRDLILIQSGAKAEILSNTSGRDTSEVKALAEKLEPDRLRQSFSILAKAEEDMRRSPLPQLIFEMAAIRLADVRPYRDIGGLIEQINKLEDVMPSPAPSVQVAPSPSQPSLPPVVSAPPSQPKPEPVVAAPAPLPDRVEEPVETLKPQPNIGDWESKWREAVTDVCKRKPNFKLYLGSCRAKFEAPEKLIVNVADSMTLSRLKDPANFDLIRDSVDKFFGSSIKLELIEKKTLKTEEPKFGQNIDGDNGKIKEYNEGGYQNDIQIIQEAIDIFGGKVIR
jgi:DNA polymerase III subunit gamma/tau